MAEPGEAVAGASGSRPAGRGTGWAAPGDALPLSAVQEAMWISWERDLDQQEHLIPLALDVTGDLDTERLRAAVAELSRRHPLLRARVDRAPTGTRLTWAGTDPVPFTVRTVDADRDAALAAACRPFDLNRGPLARAEVLRGPDFTVVQLTVHHLVLDGTSIPLLCEELRRAYAGHPLDGPDDPRPVIAHARRSWELALGADGEPHRAYWRTVLADPAPARPLPVRPEPGGYQQLPRPIDQELVDQVRKVAAELGVTYFTVMFAALFVTLHRHTATDDLIVSAPYHGRSDPALAGRIGFFVNVLPFREHLPGTRTYADLLTGLRAQVQSGSGHGELPQPAILRAAGLTAPADRDRTHQVVFQYLQFGHHAQEGADVARMDFAAGGARAELSLRDLTDVADHRLTVLLAEDSRGSRMLWKDPHGTVDPDLLASLARDHLAVVADMVADPYGTLADGQARLPAVSAPPPDDAAAAAHGPHAAEPAPALDAPRPQAPAPSSLTSPTAVALAEIWHQVLGVPVASADDSFFEMGGHSLLATTLLTRIGRRFGTEPSLRDLFSHPGFGELVRLIDQGPAPSRATQDDTPAARPEPGGPLPASGFQESIWLAQRLDPVHATYHVPLSWDVAGELDPARLRRALALLVSRHEILRTRFVDRDGRLYQEVAAPWTPEAGHTDLTGLPAAAQDLRLRRWADEAAGDLVPADGHLLRAALFTRAPQHQVLSLCVHHLVLDGESVPHLVRELERCYAAAGGEAMPPAPPHQYRDLVSAEHREPRAAADLAYWCDRLAGAPSSLGLSAPRSPEPAGNLGLRLADEAAQELLAVQRAERASAFMIQATAVAAALHRWTGRTDLTFGIPVANRGGSAFDDVIGPCLNTLVLRSRCARDTTLGELLRTLREEIIGAFEHRAASFDDVVRGLRPARLPGHTPYADVLLNSVSLTHWSGTLGDAALTPVDFVAERTETSKFPLTVTFAESGSAVRGSLAYRGDRIRAADAGELAGDLAAVLNRFGALLPDQVFTMTPCESRGRDGVN
ncbi:condensation domain-containing protein [Streptomyces pinistramenti]|uniref:condensation domain-containing protein n=1 Tax=Streptomyces pinistramenti TaxID=2884812 RepID=UPI001D0984C8|nr:condensation domain-containing protein [Streptomyces pinistramenti]MCB5906968.1 condensation domain-containing protein [Streptomyces pinistramenti]